jgi:hypothetical protein
MKKSERKSRTSKLRIIEITVWLVIFLVVLGVGVALFIKHEQSFETHRIIMPDVDGLIVGSPVNIMGIPVGSVTKTKIRNDDEVLVKFKITNKNVHIQKGTVATVEFSGLGGSKSLELYPPNKDANVKKELLVNYDKDFILVERPKRLRDCWSLLYQMYQKLVTIIYNLSDFGAKMSTVDIERPTSNTIDSFSFINYADNWIESSYNNMATFQKLLENNKKRDKK